MCEAACEQFTRELVDIKLIACRNAVWTLFCRCCCWCCCCFPARLTSLGLHSLFSYPELKNDSDFPHNDQITNEMMHSNPLKTINICFYLQLDWLKILALFLSSSLPFLFGHRSFLWSILILFVTHLNTFRIVCLVTIKNCKSGDLNERESKKERTRTNLIRLKASIHI